MIIKFIAINYHNFTENKKKKTPSAETSLLIKSGLLLSCYALKKFDSVYLKSN